jgi:hypothetical protein
MEGPLAQPESRSSADVRCPKSYHPANYSVSAVGAGCPKARDAWETDPRCAGTWSAKALSMKRHVGLLLPGMTATVTVGIARDDDVLRVPNSARRFQPTADLFLALGQTMPEPAGGDASAAPSPMRQPSGGARGTSQGGRRRPRGRGRGPRARVGVSRWPPGSGDRPARRHRRYDQRCSRRPALRRRPSRDRCHLRAGALDPVDEFPTSPVRRTSSRRRRPAGGARRRRVSDSPTPSCVSAV